MKELVGLSISSSTVPMRISQLVLSHNGRSADQIEKAKTIAKLLPGEPRLRLPSCLVLFLALSSGVLEMPQA